MWGEWEFETILYPKGIKTYEGIIFPKGVFTNGEGRCKSILKILNSFSFSHIRNNLWLSVHKYI